MVANDTETRSDGDRAPETAALDAEAIMNCPRLAACIREQAAQLLSLQAADPRAATIFAAQQRWLMAHVTLAQWFGPENREPTGGVRATWLIDAIVLHDVASRNTAGAFLKEMEKYGYLQRAPVGRDRRIAALEPTSLSLEMLSAWLSLHLGTLDALDGGDRRAAYARRPELLASAQPLIADALLRSNAIREPEPVFSLFTWLNEGGIVMDWLCHGLQEPEPGQSRILSTVASFDDLRERIQLSPSHLTRKLRAAEAMGSLGWYGARGKSPMWVSSEFLRQYHRQQSAKLAIVESAFRAAGGALHAVEGE